MEGRNVVRGFYTHKPKSDRGQANWHTDSISGRFLYEALEKKHRSPEPSESFLYPLQKGSHSEQSLALTLSTNYLSASPIA